MFADEDFEQARQILKHIRLLEKVEFDIVSQNDIIVGNCIESFYNEHIRNAKAIVLMLSIDFNLDFWLAKIPIKKQIIAIYLRHLDSSLYFKNIKHTNFTLLNKKPLNTTDDYYSKTIKQLKQKLIPSNDLDLTEHEHIAIWFF